MNTQQPEPNRMYKARIFEMLFHQKPELLQLYNAINGTHYDDLELLEINTLENAIYMSMHNDISFVIDARLSLYEHQSTYNPNLPIRDLFYISDIYSRITKDMNLYSSTLQKIPTPRFLIFYNGQEMQPDRKLLKLSDAFLVSEKDPSLELTATMININKGHNPNLMQSCKTLQDYAEYTDRIRRYAGEMDISDAVELTITECIQEGILAEFLSKNRSEATKVSIYEYDAEKHIKQEREEYLEIGRKEGLKQGSYMKLKELIEKKVQKGKAPEQIADELEESVEVIESILSELGL